MTARDKAALVARLAEGRARAKARRPQLLAECEAAMDEEGRRHRAATTVAEKVASLRRLEDLGARRYALKWGER